MDHDPPDDPDATVTLASHTSGGTRHEFLEQVVPNLVESSGTSNHSWTRFASTDGANGRKDSRIVMARLMRPCIVGLRASPRMLRPPYARGPIGRHQRQPCPRPRRAAARRRCRVRRHEP